jgi:hypothetical protein
VSLPPRIRTELRFAVWMNAREASRVLAVFRELAPAQEYAEMCRARRDRHGIPGTFGIALCELVNPVVAVIGWERG